jgi:choloylglycine hydrolase
MRKLIACTIMAMLATASGISQTASACTDFRITAKDGSVIIARSMEFAVDLKSNLRTSPRGRNFNTLAADGKPGLSWRAKYGYVFLDGFGVDAAIDGMNEQGLSLEVLYLPNFSQFQLVPSGKDNMALSYLHFGDWVLSNFKTVDEVRQALSTIYVFSQPVPEVNNITLPIHFAIYDASGKGIVVEYVNGKLNIFDNKIGVMTNSPTYDWHLTNLDNYNHLKPINPSPVVVEGVQFASNGQGFGMIGLPGDISPPSRFVKAATLLSVVTPVNDATGALNLAEHIINNFDIPLGLAREQDSGKTISETTNWVVFKDLTHKVFYYRTYEDLSLHAVAFSKLNIGENAVRLKMPIAGREFIQDMTEQFLKSPG